MCGIGAADGEILNFGALLTFLFPSLPPSLPSSVCPSLTYAQCLFQHIICQDVKLLLLLALDVDGAAVVLVTGHFGDARAVDQAGDSLFLGRVGWGVSGGVSEHLLAFVCAWGYQKETRVDQTD
jgi:hypothetical protein